MTGFDRPSLPARTLRLLHVAPRQTGVAVLLRHAERPPFVAGEDGSGLPITADGRRLARALGEHIAGRLRSLRTSPILRCVETAEALRAGAGAEIEIEPDRLLGDPGVFVLDGAKAWQNWLELGNEGVIAHLVERDDPLPGMAPPAEAAQALLAHLLAVASGRPGLHVFVTHDALVAPTAARALGVRLGPAEWPGFLECALFWNDGGRAHVAYRDRAVCARSSSSGSM